MIGKLTGRIDGFSEDSVIVDVGGVGYVVFCDARTRDALPRDDTSVSLIIETRVREDAIDLFGFQSVSERDFFRVLLSVQGVGTKAALAILSTCGLDALSSAVLTQDKAPLLRAQGVGAKLASRIVLELKDRLPASPIETSAQAWEQADSEAVSALVNLGYDPAWSLRIVAEGAREIGDGCTTEALIRHALKKRALA